MPTTKKAIHFDLSVKEAFRHGVGLSAWGKVRSFMERNGFEHIQGSGYESKKVMSYKKAAIIIRQLEFELPWFAAVAKDARLTSVGKYHDILDYLNTLNNNSILNSTTIPPTLANEEELDVEQEEADVCAASEQLQHIPNGLTQSLGKSER